jgi:hypothetical protein
VGLQNHISFQQSLLTTPYKKLILIANISNGRCPIVVSKFLRNDSKNGFKIHREVFNFGWKNLTTKKVFMPV